MNRSLCISAVAGLAAGLALSACGTLKTSPAVPVATALPPARAAYEPAPPPVRLTPPIARGSCVPRALPRAPKYPDTAEALRDAGGAADRYQLMAAGRILRERRLTELERAIDACRATF